MSNIYPAPEEFTAVQLAEDPILRYFHYRHLPPPLQAVSECFCTLAQFLVTALPRNAERTVALRKLLEAKDAGVRAAVPGQRIAVITTKPIEGEIKVTGGEKAETPVPFREN